MTEKIKEEPMQNEVSGKTGALLWSSWAKAAGLLAGIIGLAATTHVAAQEASARKGFSSFGPEQTIADASRLEWAPLKLDSLAPGAEIAVLRGDLSKGPSELLLRIPAGFTVPNHSHSSDETYVWLTGPFIYIAGDGREQDFAGQAFIGLPPKTPHALRCGNEPCLFYLRYSGPFDWHVHPMPEKKSTQ